MKAYSPSSGRVALVLSLGSAMMLAGCVPGGETTPEDDGAASLAQQQLEESAATLLWQSEDEQASRVQVVEDLVLAYVREEEQLRVIARDLETGKQLWQRDARPGANPSGISFKLDSVRHQDRPTFAFLEPVRNNGTRIVVVDARTGETLISWGSDFWGHRPEACGGTWCVEGIDKPTRENHDWQELQLDWDSARWEKYDPADLPTPKPEDARYVGPGLSSTAQRGPGKEQLVFASDGAIQWERPYEEIFDTRYSSDSGWEWHEVKDPAHTLIGGGSRSYDIATEDTYVLDWAKDYMTVAVEAQTGKVLWKLAGAQANCGGALSEWVFDARRTVVLCKVERGLGSVSAASGGSREQNLTGLQWRAIAVDTWTGRELWSHALPDIKRTQQLLESETRIMPDTQHVVLPLEQGWQAMEIASGTVHQTSEVYDATVLCSLQREYVKLEDPHDEQGQYVRVPDAVQPCDRDSMEPSESAPSYGEFLRAGFDESKLVALSGHAGMLVYRMPESAPPR